MQKRRAFKTDIDKSRLHARQYARYPAQVDIAGTAARCSSLYMQLLYCAKLNQRNPRLVRCDVNE
jgi:hypothetical protein